MNIVFIRHALRAIALKNEILKKKNARVGNTFFPKCLPMDHDGSIQSLLEDLSALFVVMINSDHPAVRLVTLMTFLKHRCDNFCDSALVYIKDLLQQFCDDSVKMQSSDSSGLAPEDKFKAIATSDVFKKLNFLFVAVACLGTLGWNTKLKDITKLEAKTPLMDFIDLTSIGHYIISCLKFVLVQLRQFLNGGSWSSLFHGKQTYTQWAARYQEIEEDYVKLHNPAQDVDKHDLIKRTRQLLKEGDEMAKMIRKKDEAKSSEARSFHSALLRLIEIDTMLTTRVEAQKPRKLPMALAIVGKTSVGKSTFIRMLYHYFAKIRGKDSSADNLYTMNATNEFMDGFTASQWCIVFDDVAIFKPDRVTGVDPSLAMLLRVVNMIPEIAHQASLEDKGKNPIDPELVLVTSNMSELGIKTYYNCPLAVARRIPYRITLEPKEEFRGPNGCLRVPDDKVQRGFCDYWTITVSRPQVEANGVKNEREPYLDSFKYVTEHIFDDITQFLQFYANSIEDHFRHQEIVLNNETVLHDMEICDICKLPCCNCEDVPEMQSLDTIVTAGMAARMRFVASWGKFILQCILIFFFFFFNPWVDYSIFNLKRNLFPILIKKACEVLGERIYIALGGKALFVLIIGALASFFVVYQLIMKGCRMQTDIKTVGEPFTIPKERESQWVKANYELCSFDLPPASCSLRNLSNEELALRLAKNLYRAKFTSGSSRKTCNLVNLNGSSFATTTHSLHDVAAQSCELWCPTIERSIYTQVNTALMRKIGECTLMDIYGTNRGKSLVNLVPQSFLQGVKSSGMIITRRGEGELKIITVKSITSCFEQLPTHKSVMGYYSCTGLSEDTIDGDCGAMLVIFSGNGPILAGMHVAFYKRMFGESRALAVPFAPREGLLIDNVQNGAPLLQAENGKVGSLGPLHENSDMRYMEKPCAYIHGSFSGWRSKPRSKIKDSPVHNSLVQRGITTEFAKPDLGGWEVRRRILDSAVYVNNSVDPLIALACKIAVVNDWMCIGPQDVSMTTLHEAINGSPGVRFVDRLNMKASAGFPWRTTKKKFLVPLNEEEGLYGPVFFTDEVLDRVQVIFDGYDKKTLYHPVWTLSIKDEIRKKSKIADKNYRGFFAGPVDYIIVMRMVLLRFIRVAQCNKSVFETAVGTEAQCCEWEEIRSFILAAHPDGDRCVFGDFKSFDVTMVSQILGMAFEAIADYIELNSTDEKLNNYARMIACEFRTITVDAFGDLITLIGINPSGNAITVIINGIVNSMYMRYVYLTNHPRFNPNQLGSMLDILSHFKKHVSLMTYGDDNGMSVHKDCDWFDHTKVQESLGRIGVTYTMADKDAKSVPFINFDQGSFLQRTWRWESELNHFVCPLKESSIQKSLFYVRSSDFCSDALLVQQSMETALREYFWYGRTVFEEKKKFLFEIAKENDIVLSDIMFDAEKKRYLENSEAFLASEFHTKMKFDADRPILQAEMTKQCLCCKKTIDENHSFFYCLCGALYRCLRCKADVNDQLYCSNCDTDLPHYHGDTTLLFHLQCPNCKGKYESDEMWCPHCHIIHRCVACESELSYLHKDGEINYAFCSFCAEDYEGAILYDCHLQALETCLSDELSQRTHSDTIGDGMGKSHLDCASSEHKSLVDCVYLHAPCVGTSPKTRETIGVMYSRLK